MTERGPRDFPDGSVGRYVRERWGALPESSPVRADDAEPGDEGEQAEQVEAEQQQRTPELERPRIRRTAAEPTRRTGRAVPERTRPMSWPRTTEERGRHYAPAGEPTVPAPEPGGDKPEPGGDKPEPAAAKPEPAADMREPVVDKPEPPAPVGAPYTNGEHPDMSDAAEDPGWAERAAAREKWAFGATEIRPAAPRPSAPALDGPRELSTDNLLRRGARVPQSGWRWWVYRLSGRLINPGESPAEMYRRELAARVNSPLLGCYKIAMLSLKGGVGKTTMTATLGATFASMRGDRVVAVDANPDRGTLSQKIPLETSATVRHLLRDAQRVRRYTDVRAYTSQGPSRLEVLASEQDPAVSEAFAEDDYRRTITLLEHFYNIVLTDCGTGLMHSAMYGVLGMADQLVIVSSGSIDGARSASATMDWLDAHGHGDLVRNGVAVINSVHRRHGAVHLERVAEHFAARCRAVVRIPFDPHLEEGAEIDLDRLEPATRLALLELAAAVADSFSSQAARA